MTERRFRTVKKIEQCQNDSNGENIKDGEKSQDKDNIQNREILQGEVKIQDGY